MKLLTKFDLLHHIHSLSHTTFRKGLYFVRHCRDQSFRGILCNHICKSKLLSCTLLSQFIAMFLNVADHILVANIVEILWRIRYKWICPICFGFFVKRYLNISGIQPFIRMMFNAICKFIRMLRNNIFCLCQ